LQQILEFPILCGHSRESNFARAERRRFHDGFSFSVSALWALLPLTDLTVMEQQHDSQIWRQETLAARRMLALWIPVDLVEETNRDGL